MNYFIIFFVIICSNYLLISQEILWEFELDMDTLKNQKSENYSAIRTTNSSYLIATRTNIKNTDTWITNLYKIDDNGNLKWKNRIFHQYSIMSNFSIETKLIYEFKNRNYAVLDLYFGLPTYHFGFNITVFDEDGKYIEEYNHKNDKIQFSGDNVICYNRNDELYFLFTNNSQKVIKINKYSSTGDFISSIDLDSINTTNKILINKPCFTNDNKYIFATNEWSTSKISSSNLYVINNNNELFNKIDLNFTNLHSPTFLELSDSSFIMNAFLLVGINAPEKSRIAFAHYSNNHIPDWDTLFGNSKFDDFASWCQTSDNCFLAGFSKYHFFDLYGYSVMDFQIIKYNNNFEKLWELNKTNDTLNFNVTHLLSSNDGYYFAVYDVVDTAGNIRTTKFLKFKDNTTNVNYPIKIYYDIDIVPNPSSKQINIKIEYNSYSKSKIELYNLLGIKHKEIDYELIPGENLITINVGDLPIGVYFVVINTGKEVRKQMFVKE